MIGILVVTHGTLAQALVKTAELIIGKQKKVRAVVIKRFEGLEDLEKKIAGEVASLNTGRGVLVLTDMSGGSTCLVSLALAKKYSLAVVTGVNLPMLLEAVLHRDRHALKELAGLVVAKGRQSIEEKKG